MKLALPKIGQQLALNAATKVRNSLLVTIQRLDTLQKYENVDNDYDYYGPRPRMSRQQELGRFGAKLLAASSASQIKQT